MVVGATSSEGIFSLFMLKSFFFLKIDYRLLKIDFFLDYRFWRYGDDWLLECTGLLWGLMQPSKQVVERQAYKQTGHTDWADCLRTRLATRHLLKLCCHRFTPVVYCMPLSPFLPHILCGWLNVFVTDLSHWWGGQGLLSLYPVDAACAQWKIGAGEEISFYEGFYWDTVCAVHLL